MDSSGVARTEDARPGKAPDPWKSFPPAWAAAARSQLRPGEGPLAWFEPDLDDHLRYQPGLVLLTAGRLLRACGPAGDSPAWEAWELTQERVLRARQQNSVGTLELTDDAGRLAAIRYTAGKAPAAARLAERRESHLRARAGDADLAATVCPACGAVIDTADGTCAACAAEQQTSRVFSLFRLRGYARRHAGLIVLGLLLTMAGAALGLVPPYLIKELLDRVLIPNQGNPDADFGVVWFYLGGLALAAVLAWFTDWGRVFVLNYASEFIAADLRGDSYSHLQRLSLEYFGGKRTGDLISRVKSDSDRLCTFLSVSVVDFLADTVFLVLASAMLLKVQWSLALVTLLPFPFIAALVAWVRGRLMRNFRRAGVAESDLTSVLADTIPGIRVVKAFGQEEREIARFAEANNRVLRANNRTNVLWSFFSPTVSVLTSLGVLVVWGYAAFQVFAGEVTVGDIVFFVAVIERFYGKIGSMIRMVQSAQRAAASAQRIFEILDRVPSVPEPIRPVPPGRLRGAIELRGVRFKYGTREVLHGLDLAVAPGEMIGLVGPSGAGKSTLINLVCRFYDVAAGSILVDGTDVRSFPVSEYRRNIGLVLQEPFLFFGTIAENIAYGRPDAPREQVVAAARAARAHEFILRLPNGYDSLVGERGQSLSGGERQRVSIARALLTDPALLILDEATSSVDTETEREIQAALENLTRGRTTIAIAHRLSTLRRADRLVVIERGRIVEVGSHEELLARPGGAYARLHHAQQELAEGHAV